MLARPDPKTPRIVADNIRTLEGLRLALRDRADALNISREVLDEISGMQDGYSAKLLAPMPGKKLGDLLLSLLLTSLGLRLILIEDEQALARVRSRLVPRTIRAVRKSCVAWGRKASIEVSKRWVRKIGRLGGQARAAALSPEERSEQASEAALIRWADVKAAARRP